MRPHCSIHLVDPYDLNDDQRIDLEELKRMLRLPGPVVTWQDALERFDSNGNGQIEATEMRAISKGKKEWLAPFRAMEIQRR